MIIIGDIHGELQILKQILKRFKGEKKLFVGDYVDSLTASNDTIIETLNLVIKNGDIILIGNHDLGYYNIFPFKKYCTGYRMFMRKKLEKIFCDNSDKFRLMYFDKARNILYTHAGVSRWWVNVYYKPADSVSVIKSLKEVNLFKMKYNHPVLNIGKSRGGTNDSGGLLWCDWNKDFFPLDTVNQVMGHTEVLQIETKGAKMFNYNIDCLLHKRSVLNVPEDLKKEIEIVNF